MYIEGVTEHDSENVIVCMDMHIYFLSLKYLLRLLTPRILQYARLSLNIIIIIIHSMASKLSALYMCIQLSSLVLNP